MASYNKVVLVGNLTRDPELKHTASGTPVAEVGLAVNDRRKNAQGEYVEEVAFVDIVFWARTAEVACQYLRKGSPVLIDGRLKMDRWESKEGQKRSKLRVVANHMQMLSNRQGPSQGRFNGGEDAYSAPAPQSGNGRPPASEYATPAGPGDDVPF